MPIIEAKDLTKTYRVVQKKPGLGGALRSLLHREYKQVHAVAGVSFAIVVMPVTDDYINIHPHGRQDYDRFRHVLDTFVRERAIPLIDLRKRLGAPAALKDDTRTVILEWDGAKIGTVVDTVTEVLQVAATEVTATPGIVKGLAAEYITGLVVKDKRTIIVLNTNKLLGSQEKLQLETSLKEHGAGEHKAQKVKS